SANRPITHSLNKGYNTSPVRAAATMMTGSCSFLKRHSKAIVIRAMSAVGMSMMERLAMTMTDPVMYTIYSDVINYKNYINNLNFNYLFK
ncbi:hypothetical protein ABTE71_19375, partial [Acinetobacter baumannii]